MARSDKAATPATLDPTKSAAKPTSKAAKPVTARKVVDWESVGIQYRAGIRSLKDIGREFDVSDAAIVKRAKRDGWTRDLKAKIHAKAESKVSESLVSAQVSAQTKVREREVIEANASAMADVLLAHRRDIQRSKSVVMRLLDELEQQTGLENVALLEELGELLRSEDDKGQDRLNDLYRKIISLPERAKTMKSLADSLRVTVDMQRQAFGMDAKGAIPEGGSGTARIGIEFVPAPRRAEDNDE